MYKVLVADDARVMRYATLRILRRLGLAAIEAEDGLQALELFEREKPDLVLIDVQMPGMDGLEVVRRIAAALRSVCRRPGDAAARYGGEEFALILPDSTEESARQRAIEAMRAVAALEIEHRGSDVARVVTLSIGATSCVPDADVVADTLVGRADEALYAAKRAGRNLVVVHSELPLPGQALALDLDLGAGASAGKTLH